MSLLDSDDGVLPNLLESILASRHDPTWPVDSNGLGLSSAGWSGAQHRK